MAITTADRNTFFKSHLPPQLVFIFRRGLASSPKKIKNNAWGRIKKRNFIKENN